MCRMLAMRPATPSAARDVLSDFRKQARFGATGTNELRTHPDGWGVVVEGEDGPRRLGRSVADAFDDPGFEEVVQSASNVRAGSLVLAHLRNASVGGKRPENTHPFVADGWAFAHNGTIHDSDRILAAGEPHEGETDSERFFRRFLDERKHGARPEDALRSTVDLIDARCTYSSLTCLFTDGTTLYGYRRLGADPAECGTRECQQEHYQLGVGRRQGSPVVAQEPTHLGLEDWSGVPDGFFLEWREGEEPSARPLETTTVARPAGGRRTAGERRQSSTSQRGPTE